MSKYYNRSEKPEREATPVGLKERVVYGIKYEKSGEKTIIVKGMENVYDKAQEGAELCEIDNIIKRYTNGDPFALNKVKTTYGDFINTPHNIVEAMQVIKDAKDAFNKLPADVRAAYNYDPEQFLADAGSENFKKLMDITEKEVEPIKEEEEAK